MTEVRMEWLRKSTANGVYVFVTQGKDYGGKIIERKGTVLLIR